MCCEGFSLQWLLLWSNNPSRVLAGRGVPGFSEPLFPLLSVQTPYLSALSQGLSEVVRSAPSLSGR